MRVAKARRVEIKFTQEEEWLIIKEIKEVNLRKNHFSIRRKAEILTLEAIVRLGRITAMRNA